MQGKGAKMEIELIILGFLFLFKCFMDYAEYREELRDMDKEEDPQREEIHEQETDTKTL